MTDSAARWRALEELFLSALECDPPARPAFLREACDDSGLRREVQSMLDAQSAGEELFERPAMQYVMRPIEAGALIGPYIIEGRIGSGGMGEVYRATDTRLRRPAAVKTLPAVYAQDPGWLSRFQAEARVLASLNHPGIAAIYALEDSSIPALAMELVEGPTLADRIARGPVPLVEALEIARQIAEGLEYAHEKGVIHCDLKPANIKLAPDGSVKILDFGLAKAAGEIAGGSAGRAGEIFGTPNYMAPEQAQGFAFDRRADIWSFGAVLFEMLTARRLFPQNGAAALALVAAAEPAWCDLPSATPPGIRRLLERCLTRDPKQRLRDIGEARIAIDGARAEREDWAGPRINRWRFAAAVLAVALAGFLSVWGWRQATRAAPLPSLGAVHLRIPFPEESGPWPDPSAPNAVPSPDGKRLAFIATRQGHNALWLRPLDSAVSQRVENTEDAFLPFWSPDGKSLGFFANGQLRRIPAAGGAPQTLCAANGYGGAAWSEAGVILFPDGEHLMRVPENGGDAVPETRAQSGERELLWPQFLPDGKHYLYLASNGSSQGTIFVQELGSSARTPVLETPWRAIYASGRLLFARRRMLLAQPFDLKTFRLYGDAAPLAPHINTESGGRNTAASASTNGVLAYRDDEAPPRLTWHDRTGRIVGTVGFPGEFSGPAISPDGSWLAVAVRLPATEKRDIVLFDLLREGSLRMTTDPADDMNPTWSPDGRRIAFTSDRRGRRETFVRSPFGTSAEELISSDPGGGENIDDWSPDGRAIALETFPGKQHISMLSVETARIEPYTSEGEHRARFSPDGEWVAYQSGESGRKEVFVQPYPATGAKWQISTGGGFQPQWRGDGKELFYCYESHPTRIMAVDIATRNGELHAGTPHVLFSARMILDGRNGWTVTRDGKRFLVVLQQKDAAASGSIPVLFNWPALLDNR
jgi:serine/threonine protein kinase/Tol biopolymer transport system component